MSKELAPRQYQHWMEKNNTKPSYKSTTIIGQLYDEVGLSINLRMAASTR